MPRERRKNKRQGDAEGEGGDTSAAENEDESTNDQMVASTTVPLGVDEEGEDASSDDEAPEDVLWTTGKDLALEQQRLEAAAVKR